MTDLIAGLASRTLGLIPVLQPRVTSMFAHSPRVLDREPSDRVTELNAAWNSDPEAFDAEEMDTEGLRSEEPIAPVQTRPQPLVNNQRSTLPLVRSPRAHLPSIQNADPAIAESEQPIEPDLLGTTTAVVPQPEQTTLQRSVLAPAILRSLAEPIAPQSSEVAMPPSANLPSLSETEPPKLPSSQPNQAATPRSPGDALSSDSSQNQVSLPPVSLQALKPLNQADVPFQTQSDPIQLVPSNFTPSQRSTPIQPFIQSEKTETTILSQPNAERNLEPNIKRDQNSEITPNTQIPNTQIIEPESQQFSAPEASEGVILPYRLPSTSNNTIAPRTSQDITPRSSEITVVPPTIQVTIGRIDIRAVAPPPPTRTRPSSSPPKLSLDDYLRSRSGG